jgi:hypothetical protein
MVACVLCFCAGRGRRRPAGPGELKGRVGRLAAGLIGLKDRGNSFWNKIGFLNLQML